jgi:asparagine synthase (glutamine-hydrolysing)
VCGLNGIVHSGDAPPDTLSLVRRMNGAIAHRGPDGEGTWTDAHAALGHRRLSIIDLSDRGREPMLSADGTLVLVCNGEIYNYRGLRSQFVVEGYAFRSNTDIEVILPLYEKYGERCVDHLVGMFAFALWDTRRRRLLLVRDRVGEKPLYVAAKNDRLAFSSEPKGLLTLPWVDRTLNEEAVPLLLVHQSLPAPVTMFRGIEQLAPASYAVWENGSLRRERYWHLDFSRRSRLNGRSAVAAYAEVLGRSVEGSQTSADVPVGVMLSGGVDSSTIAALAVRNERAVSSFCVGGVFNGTPDVELQRASVVARLLGTHHETLHYDRPELSRLPQLMAQYGQPIWSPVILYADRLVARMRDHVKVVLTGNGADEAFGGYAAYARLPAKQAFGFVLRAMPGAFGNLLGASAPRLRRFIASVRGPMADWRGDNLTLSGREMLPALCHPKFARHWKDYEAGQFAVAAARECNPRSLLDAARYADLMVSHQHGHCVIPDIAGMTYGLEMRSPYLDHRVLEFAAALPHRNLLPFPYRTRHAKSVTKKFLAGLLPRDIVYAPKIGFGFGVSFADQITGDKSQPVRDCLLSGRYLDLGIFTRAGAEWALAHSPLMVWMLLCFSTWCDVHLFGQSTASVGDALSA